MKHLCHLPRAQAKLIGARVYVGVKSCPKGHDPERYTSGGNCTRCLADASASKQKKVYDKIYYLANRERASVQGRRRYEDNRARHIENVKKWCAANPDRRRAIANSYKSRRRSQESAGISGSEQKAWADAQQKVCYWCGVCCQSAYHIDHYEPLSRGGKHVTDNLVIACPSCNLQKSSKDPYEFAQQRGRLF